MMSDSHTAELDAQGLLDRARVAFQMRFNRAPVFAASAPGRVNLIGDHIDYCDGYVLPAALQFSTLIVGALNGSGRSRVLSVTETGQTWEAEFPAPESGSPGNWKLERVEPAWANYVVGVVAKFPVKTAAFDAVIVSNVPMGGGVSSSAALEVSTFTLLEALSGYREDPVKKAQACQRCEHEFAGMPCGIMDQYVSTMARKNHALLIDCRSLTSTHIPLRTDDVTILVINSNVKHQLTGSEYPTRRAQCQEAARLLKKSLRDATLDDLQELKRLTKDADVVKRAEHVITEIARTEEAAKCLQAGDYKRAGELFLSSHESLSRLMEVSCSEVDALVDAARRVPGVWGARMTGGGFGGCVVALVEKQHVGALKAAIRSQYKGSPTFFECRPGDGARQIHLQ